MEKTEKTQKAASIHKLAVSAIFIALAWVLSMVKVYELPLGGSITLLSMLPICLLSLKYGVKWGMFCSFLYSLIQLGLGLDKAMSWGMNAKMWIGCIVFDYVLAFTVLGLAGIFGNKKMLAILMGTALSVALRFVCHFISGSIFFDVWMPEEFTNPFFYSLVYNGSYMLPELIFTVIGANIIFAVPAIRKMVRTDNV